MINLVYICIGILSFTYLYSVGVYFVAKKLGYEKPSRVFVPFYCFSVTSKLIGTFSIFTIPVKKYMGTVIILVFVVIASCIYGFWGSDNLPELSKGPLWQIMAVIICICLLTFYACLVSSTTKLFLKFKLEGTKVLTILTMLIIPIPFVYISLSRKELRIL